MKTVIFFLLCLASVLSEFPQEESVLVLSADNFDQALEQFDYILVEFYAPWCGHCKQLAPEYASAAQKLSASQSKAVLAKVDCNLQTHLCEKYGVTGFPTIKFYVRATGLFRDYKAGRTASDIVTWVTKKTEPSSVCVTTIEDAEKFIKEHQVACLLFSAPDSQAYKNFLTASSAFDDVFFGHTNEQQLREKYNIQGETIILFKQFDEGKNVLTEDLSNNAISNFITVNKFPTVSEFDQPTAQRIFSDNKNAILLFRGNGLNADQEENAFRTVGFEFKNKLIFSVVRFASPLGPRVSEFLGVHQDDGTSVVLVQPENQLQKYRLNNQITADNIRAFVKGFYEGSIEPYLKSQEVPTEPYEDYVRVVVASTWKEIVLDETKDVLIELYAPWCGHCKKLAPVFSALGSMLENDTDVVIAKMDLTANEVQGLNVNGYPTILLYQKDSKHHPIDYDGDRFEEGFIDFLRQNTNSQNLPPPVHKLVIYYKRASEALMLVAEEIGQAFYELYRLALG